ncbi:hypothetical protein V5F34_15435 [Xanthobacter autotrophicus]|uniref:hypothetical protein n=1 Tax=Xanthobacter autotrophicus TaxID=280 RepID=UPI00372C2687
MPDPSEDVPADGNDGHAELEALVSPKVDEKGNPVLSPLKQGWHYLQVYLNYGVRLPTDDADLRIVLANASLAEMPYYRSMKSGLALIKTACKDFMTDGLPEMLGVGNDLKRFAENAVKSEGDLMGVVEQLVKDGDLDAAAELIKAMRDDAQAAVARTLRVEKSLGKFSGDLGDAAGKLEVAQGEIESDHSLQSATIAALQGDEKTAGSLAQLQKAKAELEDQYDHEVAVAATTPTYAWVGPPIGLIAAVVVAGVYGDRATKTLREVEQRRKDIADKSLELDKALRVRDVSRLAERTVANASRYTALAISHVQVVKTAWNGLGSDLQSIAGFLKASVRTGTAANNSPLISDRALTALLNNVEKKWAALYPNLVILTQAPYIKIDPNPSTMAEQAKAMDAAMTKKI